MRTLYSYRIASLCMLILLSSSLKAQWFLGGNPTINPTTDWLGTQNSADLVMRTNSTEKMRIKNTGEVGIGTTSPSSWLHVNATGTGETFRTTNPSGNDTYWRMFTGSTEYGRLLHFDGGNGFFVVAPQG